MRHLASLLLILICVITMPQIGQAQDRATVEILDIEGSFPDLQIQFRVLDEYGRPVADLREDQVSIIEAEISEQSLRELQPINIADQSVVGATIGIVFDRQIPVADPATETDAEPQPDEALTALVQFLLAEPMDGTERPEEALALFVPRDDPRIPRQPPELGGFTDDINALLRQIETQDRQPAAADLLPTIIAAIDTTAAEAQRRGSNALLLVISDGNGSGSETQIAEAVTRSQTMRVPILAFGVGNDAGRARAADLLSRLATPGEGRFVARPALEEIQLLRRQYTPGLEPTLYQASYRSELFDTGVAQPIQVIVTLDGGTLLTSEPVAYDIGSVLPEHIPLESVWAVLRWYLPLAGLIALLGSCLFAFLRGLQHRRTTEYYSTTLR